ncbi:MAG: hypothetical protein KAT70_03140 [Thermoplasmata archaeon]|nr:hypothetical protein [Thermoplasmata archaeon]
MKVAKITDGRFDVSLTSNKTCTMRIFHKEGQICISMSSVLLNDKDTWYELPFDEIRSAEIVDDETFKLIFSTDDFEATIEGSHQQLRALRHLLLPILVSNT